MECMMPPCKRMYPLWMNITVFSGIARRNVTLSGVVQPALHSSIMIAIALRHGVRHALHAPNSHAGKSLNPLMYSNVPIAQQQLLPFGSCVLSVAVMAINMIVHRALSIFDKQKGA